MGSTSVQIRASAINGWNRLMVSFRISPAVARND
jgi:hypothetical protein